MQRDAGFNDLLLHGGYIYAAYFLTGEHMPWKRSTGTLDRIKPFENFFLVDRCCGGHGTGWGAWQVAARYSYADFNDEDVLGGIGQSVTLGLNWYWNANTRLQLNYINGNIDNMGATALGGDYDIVGARFMIDF
jgi:phosphate-selective porin OprO/OprP